MSKNLLTVASSFACVRACRRRGFVLRFSHGGGAPVGTQARDRRRGHRARDETRDGDRRSRRRRTALSRPVPERRSVGGRDDRARRRFRAGHSRDEDAGEVPAAVTGRMTMAKKTHGKTASGVPITDELVAELAEKAESGYDVDEMVRRRGGPPPIGTAAAGGGTVRPRPQPRGSLGRP